MLRCETKKRKETLLSRTQERKERKKRGKAIAVTGGSKCVILSNVSKNTPIGDPGSSICRTYVFSRQRRQMVTSHVYTHAYTQTIDGVRTQSKELKEESRSYSLNT
ncbi:hypothetical protein K0M31_010992 [Melipona bicolor]|uniref:Uncharacterized protein n=1 Tax=Melipona bicolor TaxID=60889 RepID=A0AA40FKX2_9HYME|nr:hypothetical protein K0M31_010992 [Melipona bicolor]